MAASMAQMLPVQFSSRRSLGPSSSARRCGKVANSLQCSRICGLRNVGFSSSLPSPRQDFNRMECNGYGAASRFARQVIRSDMEKESGKVLNKQGAGKSWVSPDWLTGLVQMVKGKDESGIPIADAKLEDVQDLLGGALFLPLFKWMKESGPIYRLAAGPRNFVIVSDPQMAKHVLRAYGTKYAKGLVAEVAEFLFGSGFAIAENQLWTVRILILVYFQFGLVSMLSII